MTHIHTPDCSCSSTPPRAFAHLHQHTQYSVLDGAAKLKELLKWVKEVTPTDPACAITDHGNMHGSVHFYNYARELGVKPIIGFEAYVVPGHGTRRDRTRNQDGERAIFHLTMLAQNFQGYQNLSRLTSRSHTEGFYYKPRIDHELLAEHHEGLIVLSGCLGSEVQQLIKQGRTEEACARAEWYAQTFKDRYYIEIQRHGRPDAPGAEGELARTQLMVNAELRSIAQRLGLGMVVTNDGHYVHKGQAEAHDTLLAIQQKASLDEPKRLRFACDDFYVKTPEELRKLLPASEYGEEAFDLTAQIAARCEDDYLPVGKKRQYQLPIVNPPAGRTVAEQLRFDTYQGLVRRYPALRNEDIWKELARSAYRYAGDTAKALIHRIGTPRSATDFQDLLARICVSHNEAAPAGQGSPAAQAILGSTPLSDEQRTLLTRAEYELRVIENMGFCDYFLIVADYINWAKSQGIAVGPGRGSGAGSIVAYATRITDLDPIGYKLLFERFLNPDRISMPDFDIDFHDQRREEVVQYVREKYGADRVAQISTFMGLSSKAVLKDVLRTMNVEYARADALSKRIPTKMGKSYTLEQAEALDEIASVLRSDPQLARGWQLAKQLEGLTKASSVHAAGIVIGRTALSDLVPVMLDDRDMLTTQLDMKAVEDIGMVKMDFLGLRTLTLIEEVLRVLRRQGVVVNLEEIPTDDPATFELLTRGDTLGIFQLEGDGITAYAKQLRPRSIEDIIALSALYRPGPMDQIPTYIRRHHGKEEVSYADFPGAEDKLQPILSDTYGIPVYQEQIMQIAGDVGGYTLAEADLMRRAMGKKIREEMVTHRKKFISGATERGMDETGANRLFDLLERFADYGFNRSHSAAYGLISYQTAYLKANHPLAFMAGLLTTEQGDLEKLAEYIESARRSGMTVLGPDLNLPSTSFEIDKQGQLRFSLAAVQGISKPLTLALAEHVEEFGPFRDLADALKRSCDHEPIGRLKHRGVLETLAGAGAFDTLLSADPSMPVSQTPLLRRAAMLESLESIRKQLERFSRSKTKEMKRNAAALFAEDHFTLEPLQPGVATELELLERERQALGIYLSGHPLSSSPGVTHLATISAAELLESEPSRRKEIISGVIISVTHKASKAKRPLSMVVISDGQTQVRLLCSGRAQEILRDRLKEGVVCAAICAVRGDPGNSLLTLEDLLEETEIQQLPPELHLHLPDPTSAAQDRRLDARLARLSSAHGLNVVVHGIADSLGLEYVTETRHHVTRDVLADIADELGATITERPSREAAMNRRGKAPAPKWTR